MTLTTRPMRDFSETWRVRLRALSDGPDMGSMWRWTYHDGSTWATVASRTAAPSTIVGWACVTNQEEPLSVVGVYVHEQHRRQGLASTLVRRLLADCGQHLTSEIYCVPSKFPAYDRLLEAAGYAARVWE